MKRFLAVMLLALLSLTIMAHVEAASLSSVLKNGDKGDNVFQLQLTLYQLGYLSVLPTGTFDTQTTSAVKAFQTAEGLAVDGAVGNQTWTRLQAIFSSTPKQYHTVQSGDTLWSIAKKYKVTVQMITQANNIKDADVLKVGQKLIIPVPKSITTMPAVTAAQKTEAQKARDIADSLTPELIKWSEVDRLFPAKTVARLIDVETGRSFRVRRLYGHNHADVEPLTAEDTTILKELYNGKWSWERRPVVVEVAGKRIAGSINGYPHGGSTITDNGFPGHFCLHFLDSRTHESNKVCPEHQAAVKRAAQWNPAVIVH